VAIGWFLRSAAQQSAQQLVLKRVLEGVPAETLMNRQPVTVTPDVTSPTSSRDTSSGKTRTVSPSSMVGRWRGSSPSLTSRRRPGRNGLACESETA
jgi:hypothetical protein